MATRLVTPPGFEPLSLVEAKAHLRVEHSDEDAVIGAYVSAARARCEAYQRRAYLAQTWVLSLDGFPCGAIRIPRPPLQSVESITYTDSAGDVQTLPADAYLVDAENEPGRVFPAYGTTWPAARCVPNAVQVRYIAGVDDPEDVPETVRMAMRLFLGHYYANREAVVTGTIATELPETARALLASDRIPAGLE